MLPLLPLLLLPPLAAGPYGQLREEASASGRLQPGDTAVLVGLAGELGCIAAHDPADCEALREEPASEHPLVELVPVPALLLPPLAGGPASLLLPRFPYGLGDPVTPLLGPLHLQGPHASWVRIELEPGLELPSGTGWATLLLEPHPVGPSVQAFTEPPGPPPHDALLEGVEAEAWPAQLNAYNRVQVLLPTRPLAVLLELEGQAPIELAWPEGGPTMAGQSLVAPSWGSRSVVALELATGMCLRAFYATSLRRAPKVPPFPPATLRPPRLVVLTDELGQVLDARAMDPPWDRPEPAACLRVNAKLLPPAPEGDALVVLPLTLSARDPAAPPASSR